MISDHPFLVFAIISLAIITIMAGSMALSREIGNAIKEKIELVRPNQGP